MLFDQQRFCEAHYRTALFLRIHISPAAIGQWVLDVARLFGLACAGCWVAGCRRTPSRTFTSTVAAQQTPPNDDQRGCPPADIQSLSKLKPATSNYNIYLFNILYLQTIVIYDIYLIYYIDPGENRLILLYLTHVCTNNFIYIN